MESWIFQEPERFRQEREEIENLKRSADWLVVANWNIEHNGLCVDAVIRAHGHCYEVRLSYPDLFPHAPPIVRPRNAEGRWSGHQYAGANGVLCLEYRPDNWRPEITGAQMLESAHRLFDIENPLGENRPARPVTAPSAHQLTLGQEVRSEWARWYLSKAFKQFLTEQTGATAGSFKFSLRHPNDNWIILVHEAALLAGDTWKDFHIPTYIPDATANELWNGVWLDAPEHDTAKIKRAATLDALRAISREAGHSPELPLPTVLRPSQDLTAESGQFLSEIASTTSTFSSVFQMPASLAARLFVPRRATKTRGFRKIKASLENPLASLALARPAAK